MTCGQTARVVHVVESGFLEVSQRLVGHCLATACWSGVSRCAAVRHELLGYGDSSQQSERRLEFGAEKTPPCSEPVLLFVWQAITKGA